MSPRLPSKISLKHEWKRKLGSEVARQPEGEVARQPEGEVARQAKRSQPTQPTPNPIRDRSGRPDDMQDEDKRPVLKRSMLILLTKDLVLQKERSDLLRQM